MAHFYSTVSSKGTEHTKRGEKKDGMTAHLRGWRVGVSVALFYDETIGKDVVRVFRTGGSNGNREEKIAEFKEGE